MTKNQLKLSISLTGLEPIKGFVWSTISNQSWPTESGIGISWS
jgi:hypothetical protein